jgi:ATP adenylyltransferase
MSYIQNSHKPEGCIFCTLPTLEDGPDNLIVFRGQSVYAVLNRYPYTSGHLMIVPFSHVPGLDGLDAQTRAEIMEISTQAVDALRLEYKPQGYNLGINIGEVSGAGVAEHVHLHIVPRWAGDTNFMSTVGSTRVLPEALDVTYWRIQKAWKR